MTAGTRDFVALLLCGFFLALFQEQVAADWQTDLQKELERNRAEHEANMKLFQEKMKASREKLQKELERNRAEHEANMKLHREKMKASRQKLQEDLKKKLEESKNNSSNNDSNNDYLHGLPVNKFSNGTKGAYIILSSKIDFPVSSMTTIQGPVQRKILEAEIKNGIIRYKDTETMVIDGKRFHTTRAYNTNTGKFDITVETQDDLAKSLPTICSV